MRAILHRRAARRERREFSAGEITQPGPRPPERPGRGWDLRGWVGREHQLDNPHRHERGRHVAGRPERPADVATPLTRNPVGSPANSSGSLRTSTVALWGPIGFPLRMRPGRRHVAAGSGGTKILSGRPGPGRLGQPRVSAAEQKPSRRRGDQSRHVTTRRKAGARPPASQALQADSVLVRTVPGCFGGRSQRATRKPAATGQNEYVRLGVGLVAWPSGCRSPGSERPSGSLTG